MRGEFARGGMGAILNVWDEDLRRELAMKEFLYQLWFRNTPVSFCTPDAFNLSNGRKIMW